MECIYFTRYTYLCKAYNEIRKMPDVNMNVKRFTGKIRKTIKESRIESGLLFWALTLFVCLIMIVTLGKEAVAVSSTYGDRELPIYCVDTDEKKISISFDAAWGAEDFQEIMDILDKHQVKTTFFMTGEWVEKYPECVKELVRRGHDLGNHSATHPDMTKLSKEKQKEQILKVHNAVKELTGYEMELFRPPYGAYSNEVIRTCYELDYYPIQWNVDILDIKVKIM